MLEKLQSEGQNAFLWNKLGNLYNRGNRTDLAVVAFEQSLYLDPSHAESHFSLGQIFEQIGEAEQAAYRFRQTLCHGVPIHSWMQKTYDSCWQQR